METQIDVSTIGDILPRIVGTVSTKKVNILMQAANAIDGQDFGGIIAEDGTLYGTDEGRVITWREFLKMKAKIGTLSF